MATRGQQHSQLYFHIGTGEHMGNTDSRRCPEASGVVTTIVEGRRTGLLRERGSEALRHPGDLAQQPDSPGQAATGGAVLGVFDGFRIWLPGTGCSFAGYANV